MPARLSQARKLLTGTARPSRKVDAATHTRLTKSPSPPATLSDAGKREWNALAPLLTAGGVLSRADLRMLELTAATLASAASYEAIIDREGATVPAAGGGTKGHPALQALATARAQARTLLSDFGLSPRSRAAVDRAPEPAEPNPFAEFMKPTLASFRK